MFIKPVNGAEVIDPATGQVLPEFGKNVDISQYWLRRITENVVTEIADPEIADPATPTKTANTLKQAGDNDGR
ncbi:MAG: DUF2635 domain-containing protein [Plesiomonas sp.]|uniref:DUF2635 domain-containing protein n=1 Tax=Plesiomonas sp. TaxID=2486279 RepID=UPI003F36CFB0